MTYDSGVIFFVELTGACADCDLHMWQLATLIGSAPVGGKVMHAQAEETAARYEPGAAYCDTVSGV